MTTELSICEQMTAAEYHARSELNRGDLWEFSQSRRLFQASKQGLMDVPSEMKSPGDWDALGIGSVCHTGLLERDKFLDSVAVWPHTRRGNLWADFQRENINAGRIVLKINDFWLAYVAVQVARARLQKLIDNPAAKREQVIVWEEPVILDGKEYFVPCRAMLDYVMVHPSEAWIVDVKTCRDATPRGFQWAIKDHGYWLQDAHYTAAAMHAFGLEWEAVHFLFLPISKSICEQVAKSRLYQLEPFQGMPSESILSEADAALGDAAEMVASAACSLKAIDHFERHRAYNTWNQLVTDYARCMETGDWSDDGEDQFVTISGVVP